ncbi:MAG TPA: thioredoxin domain-containing protein, partial [Candidatus Binatia bacterium]|nr:thioredoxin domain-containing protein [Candidatus Binatia bacterium]
EAIDSAVAQLGARFDREHGGFGRAPKFPQPSILELMLRHHRRTGDAASLQMATSTLEAMAAGGIRDHVGGGFHRYATDRQWRIPHFEKMLYDNAQLAVVYLEAFQVTGRHDFADVVREILFYVSREMTSPEGAFYSATDADSLSPGGHEEEGRFFTWTPAEVREVLGPDDAAAFGSAFSVTEPGNLEGRSVLARPMRPAGVERTFAQEELELALARSRARLYLARARRVPPLRDDKILVSWNGLMISAMARASFVLAEAEHLERAARAAAFLLDRLRSGDGRLRRVFAGGVAHQAGMLDDYAFLIQALLDLFEAGADPKWLRAAITLQSLQDEHHGDPSGGYFLVADDHEPLLARAKPSYDGAEPSGNSVAALNLLRLAELTQDEGYRQRADALLAAFGQILTRSPAAVPKMLGALDYRIGPAREVVIVAPDRLEDAGDLLDVVRATFLPRHAFAFTVAGEQLEDLAELVPLVDSKLAIDGRATAYVCERGRCERPAQEPGLLATQLAAGEGPR